MPIITLTTDFGTKDHYVAVLKAKLFSFDSKLTVVDISHSIDIFNIAHAAFVIGNSFRLFPEGTIHICSINSLSGKTESYISLLIENHYFIGTDNGLFSLLSDKEPQCIVELNHYKDKQTIFPAIDVFVPCCIELLKEKKLTELGNVIPSIKKMLHRNSFYQNNTLIGHIIHVDVYENLISNIERKSFEMYRKGRPYRVRFGKVTLTSISQTYNQVPEGEPVCVFNSNDFLEIAINKGNAAGLLGLGFDKSVFIEFLDNTGNR